MKNITFLGSYSHPYEYELNHWNPDPSQLECTKAIPPHPMEDTPLVMIDTEDELSKMVKELNACTEFAVDLEVLYMLKPVYFICTIY